MQRAALRCLPPDAMGSAARMFGKSGAAFISQNGVHAPPHLAPSQSITEPAARAAYLWVLGEFGSRIQVRWMGGCSGGLLGFPACPGAHEVRQTTGLPCCLPSAPPLHHCPGGACAPRVCRMLHTPWRLSQMVGPRRPLLSSWCVA